MTRNPPIVATRSIPLLPSEGEWNMLKEQAGILLKTPFLPSAIKTVEQAIAIALKGRELGIPFMQSLTHIHIINGKPTISSELMLALIFKNCPGAVIDYPKSDATECVIEARRPGGKPARFSFSMENAAAAGLTGKDSWKKYPDAMLRARTVAIVARALFPDAIMGCSYTPEEMGAKVDEEERVIDVPNEPGVSLPRVTPDQPGENDGDTDAHVNWKFQKGRFSGRTLEDAERNFGLDEMREWVVKNEEKLAKADKVGKVIQDRKLWEEAISVAADYIGKRENESDEVLS